MKTTSQSDPIQDFYTQFTSILGKQRFVLCFIGTGLVIILLFGALIFSLAFGLFFGFVLLALTFDLPYRLLRQVLRSQDLHPHLIKLPVRRIAFNCALLVMPVLFVFIVVRGLQNIGFCSQALICTFDRLLSP